MDILFLARRQAVVEWRDRQIFQAMRLLNGAGIEAKADLDKQLTNVALTQSIWDPAGFANQCIDKVMSDRLGHGLQPFLRQAAEELEALDKQFMPLGEALTSSVLSIELPSSVAGAASGSGTVHAPSVSTPAEEIKNPSGIGGKFFALTSRVAGAAKAVDGLNVTRAIKSFGAKASDGVSNLADEFSRSFQDNTGLYERLRRTGAERVKLAWMGHGSGSTSFLAQLMFLIDDVSNEARSKHL